MTFSCLFGFEAVTQQEGHTDLPWVAEMGIVNCSRETDTQAPGGPTMALFSVT